jgi:hypothetical protein
MAGNSYRIVEGVRRSKAYRTNGHSVIRAVVQNPDGSVGPEFDVRIDQRRSPKDTIDVSTSRKAKRFQDILDAIRDGTPLPPIVVQPGARGTPIADVELEF